MVHSRTDKAPLEINVTRVSMGPRTGSVDQAKLRSAQSELAITRCSSFRGMEDATRNPTDPGVIACIALTPAKFGKYMMWTLGKPVPISYFPSFRTNIIDTGMQPRCWIGSPFEYIHYHIPHASLAEVASDLNVGPLRAIRFAPSQDDLVVAQLTKGILPFARQGTAPSQLVLDQFGLILGAHVLQQYGEVSKSPHPCKGGLAPWQKRRGTELLQEHLSGDLRLAALAKECGLSASHFARAFKVSFGISAHQWLIRYRVDMAKDLLGKTHTSLAEIALRTGFSDQAALSRTFQQIVGTSPGRWRREFQSF